MATRLKTSRVQHGKPGVLDRSSAPEGAHGLPSDLPLCAGSCISCMLFAHPGLPKTFPSGGMHMDDGMVPITSNPSRPRAVVGCPSNRHDTVCMFDQERICARVAVPFSCAWVSAFGSNQHRAANTLAESGWLRSPPVRETQTLAFGVGWRSSRYDAS